MRISGDSEPPSPLIRSTSLAVTPRAVSHGGQWRVCFVWTDHGATDIKITDYH